MNAFRPRIRTLLAHRHVPPTASTRILSTTTLSANKATSAAPGSTKNAGPPAIRNIGIIAHIDAGKTTLTERMLFYAGYTQRIGDVDEGSTVTDYLPSERARGITITSACIPLLWHNARINLIDTPGHVDFTMEVARSVRVLDGAVVLLDGVAGVEAQTETVWRQANKQRISRILVINKMDRDGASFPRALRAVQTRLKGSGEPVVIQLPIIRDGMASRFRGIVDLVRLEVLDFSSKETGAFVERRPFKDAVSFMGAVLSSESSKPGGPSRLLNDADAHEVEKLWESVIESRATLVEQLSALDDQVLDAFLEGAEGSPLAVETDMLKGALRRLTLNGSVIPVLCGSAFKNMGVQPVMDAVVDYLPSPSDRPAASGTLPSGEVATVDHNDKKFCALAFKIIHDEKRGAMVFVRVYSGKLEPRTVLFNSTQKITERATKILQMYADDYEEIPNVSAGNIACILGLSETKTGDTLLIASEHSIASSKKSSPGAAPTPIKPTPSAITLETIALPPPVFVRSVEPLSIADTRKLESALTALSREDPSLVVTVDPDSGQTLLGGMGELHLEIASERLQDTHRCAATMGKVTISYRESLPTHSEPVFYTLEYDKQIFGKHSQLTVSLGVEPLPPSSPDDEQEWIRSVPGEENENIVDVDTFLSVKDMFPVPVLMIPSKNPRKPPTIASPPGYPSIEEIKTAVREGIMGTLARGPILGFPVVNLRVNVMEVRLGKVDVTSLGAVRAAVGRCLRDIMRGVTDGKSGASNAGKINCPTRLLEPIMDLNVTVPEKYVGLVTKDLTGTRRGNVVSLGTENEDGENTGVGDYESHVVHATVPLGSLLGYSTALRGMTAGTGVFSMKLLGYGRMSSDREESVIHDLKGY
ncbi:hypothetical protein CcCBS67573_g07630 [Chytriomyces confervae]|uniref:Elongation factor 2 n=1 Tax=Chytriomyces confervae TaxID=246404 RepID=A0A507ET34_9FUNG|nr:hypothetical protein CcCBS67573_g07630 [Chytriomyces confervae]